MFGFGNSRTSGGLTDILPDGTRAGDRFAGMLGASGAGKMASNEKLMILGSMLSDLAAGQGPQRILATQNMLQNQREEARKKEAMAGLLARLGGDPMAAKASVNPQGGGLPSLRDAGPDLLAAMAAGVDIGALVPLLDKAGPQIDFVNGMAVDKGRVKPGERVGVSGSNVNGTIVDMQDPSSIGMQIPDMEKGMLRVPGPNGLPMAIPMQNYDDIIAARAGRVAGAEAAAKSPFDFINVPTPTGAPGVMSKSRAAGGMFVGQSPAQRITSEGAARSQVEGQSALPQAMQQAQLALDVIGQIRNHPGMKSRVGIGAVLPAIPGTPGKDFDTLVDQAKGQVFLQATQAMRGLGPMTEQEGKAAQSALARLNQAQSVDGFNKALNDLESVIQTQVAKAQKKAGQGGPRPDRSAVEAELRRRGLIQ